MFLQLIVSQESRVKDAETEFDLVRSEYEIARERESDALDAEKYQLLQLEEEERINSLVDQEVTVQISRMKDVIWL